LAGEPIKSSQANTGGGMMFLRAVRQAGNWATRLSGTALPAFNRGAIVQTAVIQLCSPTLPISRACHH